MIKVLETNERFILICNYKKEMFLLDDFLNSTFQNATYSQGHYKEKYAIYLNKDTSIPKEFQSYIDLQDFINNNISRIAS